MNVRFPSALVRLGLLVALTIVSCNPLARPPTHSVPMLENEFGAFTLLVYDSTGLVVGAQRLERGEAAAPAFDPVVTAFPDRNAVEVAWIGGACTHQPTLALTGDATTLVLQLEPETAEGKPLFGGLCPAIGLGFAVTLSLGAPVEQGAITLEVR